MVTAKGRQGHPPGKIVSKAVARRQEIECRRQNPPSAEQIFIGHDPVGAGADEVNLAISGRRQFDRCSRHRPTIH